LQNFLLISPLPLQVIFEIQTELGTIFGYNADSRKVGITGSIELVEVDGPTIHVKLGGRFWHATDTVMIRVESFIKNRIPEVCWVNFVGIPQHFQSYYAAIV
jgi:hypothetical protein